MADLKISQLTSATLPLAGTEVLPIVQSSSTKKVATDDLTVKNVRSNATTGILQIAGPATAATRIMTVPDANFTAARTDAAQSFTGDQTLGTGNLIQGTAAKGINFTANTPAAGMTSELLNWYEEGTWTPTDASGAALAFTSVTGNYIRVGNSVTAYFSVTYPTTASGNDASIGGLPFTSSSSAAVPNPGMLTVGYTDSLLSILGVCATSASNFGLYLNTGSTVTNLQMSAKLIRGVFTYIA